MNQYLAIYTGNEKLFFLANDAKEAELKARRAEPALEHILIGLFIEIDLEENK